MDAVTAEQALVANGIDCAVITTDHRDVDHEAIARNAPLVVDTRGLGIGCPRLPPRGVRSKGSDRYNFANWRDAPGP